MMILIANAGMTNNMDLLQIKKEVNYIFETGANEVRVMELIKRILEKQWKPMESAPKDGTHILVCEKDGKDVDVMMVYWGTYVLHYPNSKPRWCWVEPNTHQDEQGGCSTANNPIGWQPLPEPMKV